MTRMEGMDCRGDIRLLYNLGYGISQMCKGGTQDFSPGI